MSTERLRLALRQLASRVARFDGAEFDHNDLDLLVRAERGEPLLPAEIRHVLNLGRDILEGSDRLERAA